jgi:hypothetical protein
MKRKKIIKEKNSKFIKEVHTNILLTQTRAV